MTGCDSKEEDALNNLNGQHASKEIQTFKKAQKPEFKRQGLFFYTPSKRCPESSGIKHEGNLQCSLKEKVQIYQKTASYPVVLILRRLFLYSKAKRSDGSVATFPQGRMSALIWHAATARGLAWTMIRRA